MHVFRTRLVVLALALSTCIGCDQATKRYAAERLKGEPTRSYLADTLRIQYAENPGGFLGLGGGMSDPARFTLFTVVNVALLAFLTGLLLFRRDFDRVTFAALSLILAGGVGNMIDRIGQNGFVTDFLNLGVGPLRTGVFNIADVAITAGALVIVASSLRPRSKPEAV